MKKKQEEEQAHKVEMAEMDEETYKSIFKKKGLTDAERDALLNDIKA